MESYFDEEKTSLTLEEDREYRIRYERRQCMRRERQRRMQKRRMMKRFLFLGVLAVGMVLIGVAIKFGRKSGAEENQAQGQEATAPEQADRLEIEKITESLPEEEVVETETEESETEVETPVYHFEETETTAVIDSPDVISTQAVLVDESTDTIIAGKGARERMIPASMTKVLTILVAAEHIPEEQLDDTFTMTREITGLCLCQ